MSLIERLEDEATRLSSSSLRNGCPDCGIASNLASEAASTLEAQQAEIAALREALEEARLIVANLPHDESLFLAKIDAALNHIQPVGDGQ